MTKNEISRRRSPRFCAAGPPFPSSNHSTTGNATSSILRTNKMENNTTRRVTWRPALDGNGSGRVIRGLGRNLDSYIRRLVIHDETRDIRLFVDHLPASATCSPGSQDLVALPTRPDEECVAAAVIQMAWLRKHLRSMPKNDHRAFASIRIVPSTSWDLAAILSVQRFFRHAISRKRNAARRRLQAAAAVIQRACQFWLSNLSDCHLCKQEELKPELAMAKGSVKPSPLIKTARCSNRVCGFAAARLFFKSENEITVRRSKRIEEFFRQASCYRDTPIV